MADIQNIDLEVMHQTHKLVVILPVPFWSLQQYILENKIPAVISEMLNCDPNAASFKALNFNFSFDSRSSFTSIHAKTSVLGATLAGLVLGLRSGMQGDPRQQGGAFVINPPFASSCETIMDGATASNSWSCSWAHYDRFNADQVYIPVLLLAAKLSPHLYKPL